jgi:hypothetical protein
MKDLLDDLLKIDSAVSYTGDYIQEGDICYSIGNAIFRYRVTGILNRTTVLYVIDAQFIDNQWIPHEDNEAKQIASGYFCSYNLYHQQYGFFYL